MSFPAYPAYRESGVAWIGKIPSHWTTARFKHVFRERDERSSEGAETLLSVSAYTGVTPRSEIIDADEHLTRADSLVGYKLVEADDLVINIMLAWNRGLGVSRQRGIVSPAYCVFIPNQFVDPRFIDYALRSDEYVRYFGAHSTGVIASRLRIYPDVFLSLNFGLPSVREQAAIASFLDSECGKIDGLVAEQERLIALLKEKRQAVISQAVTKGLDPNAPMKDSGIEWLGQVPAHWEVLPLKWIASTERGRSTHRPRNDPALYGGPYPFIQTGDVASAPLHGIIVDFTQTLNEYGLRHSRLFPKGTLVMGIAASIAKVAILGFDACFPDSVVSISVKTAAMRQEYLLWSLRSAEAQISDLAVENTQLNLNIERVGSLQIAVPPISEQIAIAAELDRIRTISDTLTTEARRAIALLRERRAALISAAVTGKIDVRGLAAPAAAQAA